MSLGMSLEQPGNEAEGLENEGGGLGNDMVAWECCQGNLGRFFHQHEVKSQVCYSSFHRKSRAEWCGRVGESGQSRLE